jgi:hypothetical protein
MRRFRLSTLMLLVVIAALGVALAVQQRRAARREDGLRAKIKGLEETDMMIRWHEMSERRLVRYRSNQAAEKRPMIEPMEVEKGER